MPQMLRQYRRVRFLPAIFVACCFALFAPHVVAQQPQRSSTPGTAAASGTPAAESGNLGREEQIELARRQGKAETAVLDWVLANSGPLTGDARLTEMRIVFAITPAEGWWDKAGGNKLAWHDAPDGNVHLRIFVADARDGRLLPGLTVHAALIDANGNQQSVPVDFGWYPLINAYGANVPIDTDSRYTLRVTVDPLPPEHRSFFAGDRFGHPAIVEFLPVEIAQEAVSQLPLATATAYFKEAELLKPCNAALSAAITALWTESISGIEKPDGDYFVGYAIDYSVGGSIGRVKNLIKFSGKEDVHLEVVPRDSRSGRIIPGLKVQASLTAADGKHYEAGELPFVWHPWLNRYEHGIRVPRKGLYRLHVHFEAPGYRRWGQQSERFASASDVEFENVSLKPEKD